MAKTSSPINDMHVVIDLGGKRRAARIAIDLAERLDAHLTGLALSVVPLVPIYTTTTPLPADLIVAAQEQASADAKSASSSFTRLAKAAGIRFAASSAASIGGDGFDDVTRHLSLTDLVIIGQQNPDEPEPMREALIESILFQAGAPAFIVPHAGNSAFEPDNAVVAWDGSATAVHAVRAALPMLSMAKEVSVVSVAESRKRMTGVPGADIATYLARHGLEVTVRLVESKGGDVAQTILGFAADEGADWLVMGAYGHSRLREFFLGGTTRSILSAMTLPALMAH